MTVRLATPADAAYIDERLHSCGQLWSDAAIKEAITSPNFITVVDPPTGLFWATLNEADPTVVSAGITISSSHAQTLGLYKAAVQRAKVIWPKAATLRAQLDPTTCSAEAMYGATQIVRMPQVSAGAKVNTYEINWAGLLKALEVTRGT